MPRAVVDALVAHMAFARQEAGSPGGCEQSGRARLRIVGKDEHGRGSGTRPEGLVFTSQSHGPLDLDNFRKRVWAPAVKAAGLAPLRIHDMRHTAASLAIKAGADVKVIQRMLGHASAAMTLDRYGHLMPGQAEAVADRLDVLMSGAG